MYKVEGAESNIPRLVCAFAQARVTFVSCGAWFTGACCDDGALYTWGNGDFGQLGLGSTRSSVVPLRSPYIIYIYIYIYII